MDSCRDDGLLQSAKGFVIHTTEEEIAEHLASVLEWCKKTARFVMNPGEIFNSTTFGEFDQILTEGNQIASCCPQLDASLSDLLLKRGKHIVRAGIARLESLKSQRQVFRSWCDKVDNLFNSSDKKVSLETLRELAQESFKYPSSALVVQRV
eukprot:CAMPEP_0118700812 /NCGR_PEP_ID=MMETSP0800-20121206/16827_1 /TAXON_ID=210618 ORGANISM="Striatella unipunctata, Strain CCMP2910" /NCGR_SAMPLE_ID=MMETSP0800 /ASSEMBLY_ACC=CAM_ASM_000638 /LENGTH=151 /DNA_ID=CAMNT_0006601511 /DNA_START=60 /DNA_END=512 /DNA_ORIENTATION=+